MSGADLLYWRRKQEQWRSLAERAPTDEVADFLHKAFEPTARAIEGLEKALAGLGLLDQGPRPGPAPAPGLLPADLGRQLPGQRPHRPHRPGGEGRMSGDATRTKAAIQARRNDTEQMLQRVRDALGQMRRDHIPAQTAMVARRGRGLPYLPLPERASQEAFSPTPSPIVQLPQPPAAAMTPDRAGPGRTARLTPRTPSGPRSRDQRSARPYRQAPGPHPRPRNRPPPRRRRENQRGEQGAPPAEPQAHHRQSAAHRADQGRPREQLLPRHPHRPPRSRPRRIRPRRPTCARAAVLTSDEVLAFKPVLTAQGIQQLRERPAGHDRLPVGLLMTACQ